MKKLVSIGLSLAIAMSVCSTKTYAIGYNKVVDNDLGGKTTYVGSERLEEYMEKLKAEMNEVRKKYEDRYEIHPWKGFLMYLSPILLATAFNVSLSFAMKIFNRARVKARAKDKDKDKCDKDNSLSVLQTVVLGVVSGFSLFLGLVKSRDYTSLNQSFDATEIWEKNQWILEELTDDINNPDRTVRLYGAEIICEPCDFLDKINKRCWVNSQKRFFTPGSTRYDPKLAETIPKLSK